METKGDNIFRLNLVYFMYNFELALKDIPTEDRIVVALPGMLPIFIRNQAAAMDMVDKMYEVVGASPIYSLVTKFDGAEVSVYLDDTLVVTGECPPEAYDEITKIIERQDAEEDDTGVDHPKW